MRRARVFKRADGLWMTLISEKRTENISPSPAWVPIFYKALTTHEAALGWALAALGEFYRPVDLFDG